MIDQTILHCKGIGPKTQSSIFNKGLNSWDRILENQDSLPLTAQKKNNLLDIILRSKSALEHSNIQFFVDHFKTSEHWRILDTYLDKASYFDIETTGFSSYDSEISVIVCHHKGKSYTFVNGDNLDDFLDLLDDVELMVSFSGTSFDVPFVVNSFRIPEFPCPHVDLRWIAYHTGLTGGLKFIEEQLGMERPEHLQGVDGFEAVILWDEWKRKGDMEALSKLIVYCQYDVESLAKLAPRILELKKG